jgi:hypothetical protein
MTIGDCVQKFWRYLVVAGTMAIFLGAGVFIVETLPPRTIGMATGIEGSANYELGIRYREILAKAGVNLQLLPTTGGMENLVRLRDPLSGVSVGFLQGGTTTKKESPELESLGTVFYEPLWLFRRSEIGTGMQDLRGRRLSIGPEGSAGRALALQSIERTKVDCQSAFKFDPAPVALRAPSATASPEEPDNPLKEDFSDEIMCMSYLYSKLPEIGVPPHIGTGGRSMTNALQLSRLRSRPASHSWRKLWYA